MKKNRKIGLMVGLALVASTALAYMIDPYLLSLRIYQYQPEIFADRWLGSLPMNPNLPPPVPNNGIWYMRIDNPSFKLHFDQLLQLINDRNIPGVDFSGQRDLFDDDLRRIDEGTGVWPRAARGSHSWRLLKLAGTRVSDRGMLYISFMKNLEMLSVSSLLTDDGLSQLGRLSSLKELSLAGSQVTDRGVAMLQAFPMLSRLDLGDTAVTDAGLKALKGLPLESLRLGASIHDSGLAAALSGNSSLVQLDLAETKVTDAGLSAIAPLKKLNTLFLGSSITDQGLGRLPLSIQRLDLSGAQITDAGVPILAHALHLEELALSQTKVTDASLKSMRLIPHLHYLELSDTAVTQDGLAQLVGCPELEVLSISTKSPLVLKKLLPLGSLPHLRALIVNGRVVDHRVIEYLKKHAVRHAWDIDFLASWAEAADDLGDVTQALADAGAPPVHQGLHGLKMIHSAESELGDVVSAPETINADNQQDTQQNFLGDFTIGVGPGKKAPAHP